MDTPLLTLYSPKQVDGRWIGAMSVNIRGERIDVMAGASEGLIRSLYDYVAKFAEVRDEPYGKAMFGKTGQSSTVKFRLAKLAPYLPTESRNSLIRESAKVLANAAQGCERCMDLVAEAIEGEGNPQIRQGFALALKNATSVEHLFRRIPTMTHAEFFRVFRSICR